MTFLFERISLSILFRRLGVPILRSRFDYHLCPALRPTSEIRLSLFFLLFFVAVTPGAAIAQSLEQSGHTLDHFRIFQADTALQLSKSLVIPNSELVYLDSVNLRNGVDYSLDN